MAPSVDLLSTSLLCAEDTVDIFGDNDDCVEHCHLYSVATEQRDPYKDLTFDNYTDEPTWLLPPIQAGDEYLSVLFKRENEHLPADDYLTRLWNGELDLVARNDAVEWIRKVQSRFNFSPLTAYLAVNYMDRFLSISELAKGRVWMIQLVALACVSLAAKMEESGVVPSTLDLQIDASRFIFEGKTIQRMELLVLSSLKWRVQSVTPYSFLDYFLSKICCDDDNDLMKRRNSVERSVLSQCVCLIETSVKGIEFLEFKPSEIAAAVAIAVVAASQSIDGGDLIGKAMCLVSEHFKNKERLAKCVEMMIELYSTLMCCGGVCGSVDANATATKLLNTNASGSSGGPEPGSPNGVLEASNILSCSSNSSSSRCFVTPSIVCGGSSLTCRLRRPANSIGDDDDGSCASKRRKLLS